MSKSPANRGLPTVILKSRKNRRIEGGHPWVYRSEIDNIKGSYTNGGLVRVLNDSGGFLGIGYINDGSEIPVRLLTREDEPIDDSFFRGKIARAIELRGKLKIDSDASRLVYSEADGLPGLIVDAYAGAVSVQLMTLGMEAHRRLVISILEELLAPSTIINKSDSAARKLEGLEPERAILRGKPPDKVIITEGGLSFAVDLWNGQKTGFYLDQRENRREAGRWLGVPRVLDCFCYTGAFSIYAAAAGAGEVTGVDSSANALKLAGENGRMNGFHDKCGFREGNVFDVLREFDKRGEKYDAVILDPPSFGSSRRSLAGAMKGYKEINLRAMKILNPGGVLVTCTCSHPVKREMFYDMLCHAAADAHRRLRLLHEGGQALDHPVILSIPETAYLRCLVLQVE